MLIQLGLEPMLTSQMRRRFADDTPSIFIGIIAFGHTVCVMSSTATKIITSPIRGSMEHVIDVAPGSRWDLDLTTAEGADRILVIFREV